jgi:hypothetical protein
MNKRLSVRRAAPVAVLLVAVVAASHASAIGFDRGASLRSAAGLRPGALAHPQAATQAGPTSRFDSTVARLWFDQLYSLIRSEKLSPPVASRVIGYAGVALYESVVGGMPHHRSLGGQLNELSPLDVPKSAKSINWPLAASHAVAAALRGLLPTATARASIDALAAQIDAEARSSLPASLYARSAAHGDAVAAAILDWAAKDGYAVFNACSITMPAGDGVWVPTPPAYTATPLQPCWGEIRPFVLRSSGECAPPPPPAFSTDVTSAFYAEAKEVYDTTTHLTAEQTAIASFWADNAATTGTPPGHWISIVGQIAAARDLTLDAAAEAYARVGLAVADAFIACWETKYVYDLLRPVTYIQQNIDSAWMPPLPTPPFPEYTSGHSVQSAAAATVLTDLFGVTSFADDTHATLGLSARSFSSFDEAAAQAAISRLYGGIHYRSAIEKGMAQGRCIGGAIVERVSFRKP